MRKRRRGGGVVKLRENEREKEERIRRRGIEIGGKKKTNEKVKWTKQDKMVCK